MKKASFHSVTLVSIAVSLAVTSASAEAKPKSHAKAHPVTRAATASSSASAGEWTPSLSLLIKLASETQFESYALRLPLGFTQVDKTGQPAGSATLKQFIYAGQKRSDKTFPVVTVLTLSNLSVTTSAGEQAQLDKALDNVEQTTTERKPNLVISSREYGEVNGLPLVREYFKFSQIDEGRTTFIHGFYYACIAGTSALLFSRFDAEPYNKISLPIAEAAALTLHQK